PRTTSTRCCRWSSASSATPCPRRSPSTTRRLPPRRRAAIEGENRFARRRTSGTQNGFLLAGRRKAAGTRFAGTGQISLRKRTASVQDLERRFPTPSKGAATSGMDNFVLVTDSTSDLAPDMIRRYGIRVVPLKVVFGQEVLDDGVNCDAALVFRKVEETGTLPTTSAASPGDFAKLFGELAEEGKKALYIGLSAEFSSTLQSAKIAAAELPEGTVEIVDSRNLSTGIGILVMQAARLREKGKSLQETAEAIRAMTDRVRTAFVIETLEYLYKGGRLSALSHMVGSMLKIRPLVKVVDGRMIVGEKIR